MAELEKRKQSKTKSKKSKKREGKDEIEFLSVPGVSKVILSKRTQEILNCEVGVTVCGENPWRYVDKTYFKNALECEEGLADLQAIEKEINETPRDNVLLFYAEDETVDEEEFYVCVTEESQSEIEKVMERMQQEQAGRINSALEKKPRAWKSLGSEIEIEEAQPRTNRSLLQVDVITKYPPLNIKPKFKLNLVEHRTDGYIAKDAERFPLNDKFMTKVDEEVQVTPFTTEHEVQTDCTYPKNEWTQYEYEYRVDEEPSEEFHKNFTSFIENELDTFCDELTINANINLYTHDYDDLVIEKDFTKAVKTTTAKEYMSFAEARLCKGKMISAVSWHPFYTGVFAVAYCDYVVSKYIGETQPDEINRIIFNSNPVLVWSFVDSLKPKLILDTPSEVNTLAFCPHDSNLIVGGCRNGRIIMWDIKNKLQQAEDEELLKPSILKYRKLLYSLMGWIKNVKNVAVVRPTIISEAKFSHKSPVSQVEWLSPFHEISEFGIIKEIPDICETFTLQFASCSEDGKILFWDLKSNHSISVDDVFSERIPKRLKKRPSALSPEISLYKALNGVFKPIYSLDVYPYSEDANISPPISSFAMPHFTLNYEEMASNPRRKFSVITRLLYKPVLKKFTKIIEQKVCVGTADGYFLSSTWNGFDDEKYEEEEKKNFETVELFIIARYHDGPVVSISRLPDQPDILLSVGGKTFCIWKENLKEKPIMWRRNRSCYTHGCWFSNKIRLTRSDGSIELWDIRAKSYENSFEQSISGNLLVGSYVQTINPTVIGVGDHNGIFRLFNLAQNKANEKTINELKVWINRQAEIKQEFINWQNYRNAKYAEKMKKIWEAEAEMQKLKEHQDRMARVRMREEAERQAIEDAKLARRLARPPRGKLAEWSQNKWTEKEKNRMQKTILELKGLKPKRLREQQQPLEDIKHAEQEKQKRKRQTLRKSSDIFHQSVDMYFPYVNMPKSPPPRNPYKIKHTQEQKDEVIAKYKTTTENLAKYIEEHPFVHEFDWHKLMKSGKERGARLFGPQGKTNHKERHKERLIERKLAAERAAEARKIAAKTLKKAVKTGSKIKKLASKATLALEKNDKI